jgi:hypothetical protein
VEADERMPWWRHEVGQARQQLQRLHHPVASACPKACAARRRPVRRVDGSLTLAASSTKFPASPERWRSGRAV